MRIFVSIILVTAVISGAGIWINDSMQDTSNRLSGHIDLVCEYIKSGDWEHAQEKTRDLKAKWQDNAVWWPIVMDHQEMDNIEFSLAKAKEFVAEENSTLALSQFAEMKLMIEHLPAKEKINLKNIL